MVKCAKHDKNVQLKLRIKIKFQEHFKVAVQYCVKKTGSLKF